MASHIEKIREEGGVCYYCDEPFKECDTLIPGIGVIIGEVDIKKYLNYYWHHGCIIDYKKQPTVSKRMKEYRQRRYKLQEKIRRGLRIKKSEDYKLYCSDAFRILSFCVL